MKKPLIALMPLFDKKMDSYWMLPDYVELIKSAGGVPVVLTFTEDWDDIETLVRSFDGFVFTGGDDIDPAMYRESKSEKCSEPCAQRDSLEFKMFGEIIMTNKPVLGICRGFQLLNAALGGSLYQDLPSEKPSEINHRQTEKFDITTHMVKINDGKLKDIIGVDSIEVNSFHHQAVKRMATGFIPCAYAEDGVIEAAYLPDRKFFLGVQWHPERLFRADEKNLLIAKAFIDACE